MLRVVPGYGGEQRRRRDGAAMPAASARCSSCPELQRAQISRIFPSVAIDKKVRTTFRTGVAEAATDGGWRMPL